MLEKHVLEYEMEIYHIFVILLDYISNRFMIDGQENIRELCRELLLFTTLISMNNNKIQDMFRFMSNGPTLLKRLCKFPFFFFLNPDGKLSLFPALIAVTYNNPENLAVLSKAVNISYIDKWLKRNIWDYYQIISKNEEIPTSLQTFKTSLPISLWSTCLKLYK